MSALIYVSTYLARISVTVHSDLYLIKMELHVQVIKHPFSVVFA